MKANIIVTKCTKNASVNEVIEDIKVISLDQNTFNVCVEQYGATLDFNCKIGEKLTNKKFSISQLDLEDSNKFIAWYSNFIKDRVKHNEEIEFSLFIDEDEEQVKFVINSSYTVYPLGEGRTDIKDSNEFVCKKIKIDRNAIAPNQFTPSNPYEEKAYRNMWRGYNLNEIGFKQMENSYVTEQHYRSMFPHDHANNIVAVNIYRNNKLYERGYLSFQTPDEYYFGISTTFVVGYVKNPAYRYAQIPGCSYTLNWDVSIYKYDTISKIKDIINRGVIKQVDIMATYSDDAIHSQKKGNNDHNLTSLKVTLTYRGNPREEAYILVDANNNVKSQFKD